MVALDNGREGLGLALGEPRSDHQQQQQEQQQQQPASNDDATSAESHLQPPTHNVALKHRRSSGPPPPILTSLTGHAGDLTASPMVDSAHTPSHRIPPPPSPRRHRSGVIMSRVRAHSGGPGAMTPNKSWGDLQAMGLSMTAASPVLARAPSFHRSASADSVPSDDGRESRPTLHPHHQYTDEPHVDSEHGGHYDNSARFYHHIHSRTGSPTRSNLSASPTARSPSPGRGGSPSNLLRRNQTLPAGATTLAPTTALSATSCLSPNSLSASLSPNSRFLQQHLPPTFPNAPLQSSPEVERENPLTGHHSMVILTPTTQEWRELKEVRRLTGDDIEDLPASDSESGSSRSSRSSGRFSGRSSTVGPPKEIVLQEADEKAQYAKASHEAPTVPTTTIDPGTPLQTTFDQVLITPAPVPWPESGSVDPDQPLEMGGVAGDHDDSQAHDLGGLHRFNSFGRRDSLRLRSRPSLEEEAARPKTKRELERERLFRMVDQEIAEGNQDESGGLRSSWGIVEIGSGSGLDSRSSFSTPGLTSGTVHVPPPPPPSEVQTPETSPKSESPTSPKIATPKDDVLPLSPEAKSSIANAPVRPSPLHSEPLSGPSSGPSTTTTTPAPRTMSPDGQVGMVTSPIQLQEVNLGSPDDGSPTESAFPPPPHTENERFEAIRTYSRSMSSRSRAPSRRGSLDVEVPSPPRSPRRRTTNRISLVAGRVVQPPTYPGLSPLSPVFKDGVGAGGSGGAAPKNVNLLQSFSPFRSPSLLAQRALTPLSGSGMEHTFSNAPSMGVPSPSATPSPTNEPEPAAGGGIGGHGIDDYVILKEAGKGAYGLVMRAKVRGANGQPVGDDVIIKYIIKSRILADCWKKHKVLGPIPVEIHVMDQLRHLIYNRPPKPHPWDPFRHHAGEEDGSANGTVEPYSTPMPSAPASDPVSRSSTGGYSAPGGVPGGSSGATTSSVLTPRSVTPARTDSGASGASSSTTNPTQRYLASEIKHLPERGHPNICKLLDFFEDREFYYLVMPCYGTGVDLFDRVESQPAGLEPFEVRSLVGQLTDSVRFLHANGIVHRDIKDENVILDGDGRCQLIDFGSAAHWRPGKRWDTFSGTLHYASPEILRGEMYGGKEQDVWALGTVAYVLLVGETPFADLPDEVLVGLAPGSRAEEALDARCGGPHAMEGLEPDGGGALGDAADFVRRCLEQEQGDRPTAEQLLAHRYLAGNGGWAGRKGWVGSK